MLSKKLNYLFDMNQPVRKVLKTDLPALKQVLDSIELFPSSMLEAMISDYLNNPQTQDIWFTKVKDGQAVSLGYCAPEKFTEGTYNLYAIGVKGDLQGQGIGGEMMEFIEQYLQQNGQRILIVETSGTPDFELTRNFYLKQQYTAEATIREFWKPGDDKVIFWKKLN
ncbi:MAG: GNAT family N-acetyltransferase [Bacteroidota bacterium]